MKRLFQAGFGPVNSIGADTVCKIWVGCDQQCSVFAPTQIRQFRCYLGAVFGAKVAINDRCFWWQARNHGNRVRHAFWISEEEQSWQGCRKVSSHLPDRRAPLAGRGGLVFQRLHEL